MNSVTENKKMKRKECMIGMDGWIEKKGERERDQQEIVHIHKGSIG